MEIINIKNMGAETKVIGKVEYVTDTDVSYYKMGEVETSFDLEALKNYIKRYGHETLCSGLSLCIPKFGKL